MEQKHWFFLIGVIIGWVTKFPFLLKWYKELKKTKDYKEMKMHNKYQEVVEKFLINKYDVTKKLLRDEYEKIYPQRS